MAGLGWTEVLIIVGILVLLFGATRLPKLGKGMGQGIKGFKDGLQEGVSGDDEDEPKQIEPADDAEEKPADKA
jgi:sec-independent protein translocase protein TatA